MTGTLEDAIILACSAHRGQIDKGEGPYILHPLRVMLGVSGDERRIAAVLHDVVEDGGIDPAVIAARFGDAVAQAVVALSRRDDEDYDAFIERCARNPIARDVKRADIGDDLDLSRLPRITAHDHERAAKYRCALARLKAIDDGNG
jgi:hypothetical protein